MLQKKIYIPIFVNFITIMIQTNQLGATIYEYFSE